MNSAVREHCAVATNVVSHAERESFLLELLYFAGWQLQIQGGRSTRIRATRAGTELDITGSSLAEAAGTLFARAMRSSREADRSGGA
jgi:hypothetical protein